MASRAFWEAIQIAYEFQVSVDEWEELFQSVGLREGSLSSFGYDLVDALRNHCLALDADSLEIYKTTVHTRVSELKSGLTPARSLLKAGAGLPVTSTSYEYFDRRI
ncbi:hypothetical protein AC1031_010010 [Aphanomyces cochlioides]|nr:hypothetical protein AC1031_010010 [Aphanomyces cochlioides]